MVSQFNIANIRNFSDTNQGVWTSVLGTPFPTSPTGAYGAGWYSLGTLDGSAGVEEAVNVNESKFYALQGGGLAKTIRSQFEHPFTVVCAELNAVTLGLARGNSTSVTSGGTAEIQTVTITGTPTGGTFTLTLPGYGVTGPLAYNATLAAVGTALSALTPGYTVANPTGTPGSSYVVTFPVALGNLPQMTVNTASLTGGTPAGSVATGTPGVNPVTTTQVLPASQQVIRQFGLDFSDGVIHDRLLLSRAEAVQTGTVVRKIDAPTLITLQINPYLDSSNSGAFYTQLTDDPAQAAGLFV